MKAGASGGGTALMFSYLLIYLFATNGRLPIKTVESEVICVGAVCYFSIFRNNYSTTLLCGHSAC